MLFGSEHAYRKLLIGFISMQLVFLLAVFTVPRRSRKRARAFKACAKIRLSQVGIANESDQVS